MQLLQQVQKGSEEAKKLVDIDQNIEELSELNGRLAKIVEVHFFGKMPMHAIADVLDISERTIKEIGPKQGGWLCKELKT